jgi:penicillin-binding protein 1A
LTRALVKSINTVPVRLARDHLGTEAIAETARKMGVETPIRTDKTMALGTSEVTVLDQATAYGVFPAGGMSSGRHGISQILTYSGDVLYDYRRDATPPHRVLTEEATAAMNSMLVQIPEWGTGRRAKLDNIKTGGKTGTTQSYRDGWFVGFTGNFTTAVWFGNDDYTSTNRMTGGSLPAMTFKQVMSYAHQGIKLRPIPYIEDPLPAGAETQTVSTGGDANGDASGFDGKAQFLSQQATDILRQLAEKFRSAPPLVQEPQRSAELVPR